MVCFVWCLCLRPYLRKADGREVRDSNHRPLKRLRLLSRRFLRRGWGCVVYLEWIVVDAWVIFQRCVGGVCGGVFLVI